MPLEFLDAEQRACGRAGAAGGAARDTRPFAFPGTQARFARDRAADIRHVRLEVSLDFPRKRIAGTVTHTFAPILDDLAWLDFDCVELKVHEVRMGGRRLRFEQTDGKLRVRFRRPLPAGREVAVSIRYSGSPRRGLYFCGPDEHYPRRLVQAWSQGQDEDSRHWFPCYDYPNQKATTELLATVPERMFALGNGGLVRKTRDRRRKTATWHWRQSIPHVSYLVTLVAGEFETAIDTKWRGVPIRVYAPPGRSADARRACGKTARMMAFFSKVTGVPYPYEKYDQVFVQDFIFGGMENTTATTLTDTSMLDRRAALDNSSDGLVAHELAHQWWGDYVTCRDWSHGWLNEGFATYFEALWKEHDLGVDEYRYYLLQMRDSYFGEDGGRYRRPIVCKTYRDPVELFDRHLYEKGALVLHMLRNLLGDDLFGRSLRLYIARHGKGNVETDDLRRAIEAETGRNLESFFDQWVYRAGHPDLKATYAWDEKLKTARVTVNQVQNTDHDHTPLFRMPLTLAFPLGRGREVTRVVELAARENTFHVPLPERPRFVRIDPGWKVLKSLDFTPPRAMLVAQLLEDEDVAGRCQAAAALGKDGSPEAVDALRRCLGSEKAFWGVRADAARALGKARTAVARDALLEQFETKHPKVRRAVVAALGEWREDEGVAKRLATRLERGDPSYLVEAELARSLGRTRTARAYDILSATFRRRDSWNEVVRTGCLAGLAELRDARGVAEAREAVRPGRPNPLRGAAVGVLGRLADVKDAPKADIADELTRLVEDWWLRVKVAACGALAELREDRALGVLDRASVHDLDGRVRRAAREAAKRIREGRDRGEDVRGLREEVEKIREEMRRLRDEVAKQGAAKK